MYLAVRSMPVREVEVARTQAVVATHPLAVGIMVTKDDLKLVPWPTATPVPGSFTDIDKVVNRGVVVAVSENEPLTESKLAPIGSGAGLPPTITEGMRAISLRVNEVIGVAGFVIPGTRVDVLVTVRNGGKGDDSTETRTVLSNIVVLTAGTRYDQDRATKEGKPIPTTVVTLAHDARGCREGHPGVASRATSCWRSATRSTPRPRRPPARGWPSSWATRRRRRSRWSAAAARSSGRCRRRLRLLRRRSTWSRRFAAPSAPKRRSVEYAGVTLARPGRDRASRSRPPRPAPKRRPASQAPAQALPAPEPAVDFPKVKITAGRSTVLSTEFDVTRIAITDPKIADAVVVQPREILIDGKTPGTVSLIIWGGGQRKQYDIVVDAGVLVLEQQLKTLFPGEDIRVTVNDEALILNGAVSSNQIMLRAAEIADGELGQAARSSTCSSCRAATRASR